MRERWKNEDSLKSSWDVRTKLIARLIEPNQSVLEFGSGRQVLKDHLPEGCTYTPTDIVDRAGGNIVCDLNGPELVKFEKHNVAVFGGVLEYINDVPRLIAHVSDCDMIIASYAKAPDEANRSRAFEGWVNDYSHAELIKIFRKYGYECKLLTTWKFQSIYKFVK